MEYRPDLKFRKEAYDIIGAAMAVHRYFGCGFVEKVYQEALAVELRRKNIPYEREVELHPVYHDVELPATFIPDFICYGKIVVELKAVKEIEDMHRSQAINYAKVAQCELALLVNFGEPSLKYERFVV